MKLKTLKVYLGILLGVAAAGSSYATSVITINPASAGIAVSGNTGNAYVGGQQFKTSGTGFIDPFLREQANRIEEGMNTSFVKQYLDNKQPVDGYTRELPLANLLPVTYNGQSYYQFWLDVNQDSGGGNPLGLISLSSLSIWISGQKTDAAGLDALRALPGNVWTMNADYDIQIPTGSGSGEGDFSLLVPVPANPSSLGNSVYLYAKFGVGAYESSSGFEEWRALTGTPLPPVPDGGSTIALLGLAMLGLGAVRRAVCRK